MTIKMFNKARNLCVSSITASFSSMDKELSSSLYKKDNFIIMKSFESNKNISRKIKAKLLTDKFSNILVNI